MSAHSRPARGSEPVRGLAEPGVDDPAEVLEHLPVAVTVMDPDLSIVYVNRASEAIFDRPREDTLGRSAVEVAIPAPYAAEAARILRAATEGAPWEGEFPVTRGDGSQVIGSFATSPLPGPVDERGRRPIVNVFRDVTLDREVQEGRERALEKERSARLVLESILDSVPVGIAFFDRSHRWTLLNERAAALTGRPAVDLVGQRLGDVVPEAEHTLGQLVDQVFASGHPVTGLEGADAAPGEPGVSRHWEVSCYPLSLPQGDDWVGVVVHDVTERFERELERLVLLEAERAARAEAVEKGAVLSSVLDSVPVGLAFFDRDHCYTLANEAAAAFAGLSRPALYGRCFEEVFAGNAAVSGVPDVLDRVFASGVPVLDVLVEGVPQEGAPQVSLLTSYYPVRLPGGSTWVGAVLVDVTEQREREHERASLLEAERSARVALEASSALLETALESSPVGMCFFDRDLRWVRTNASASRMLGIDADARVGQLLWDVLPHLAGGVAPLVEQVFASGLPVRGDDLESPDGSSWWELGAYPVNLGGEVVMAGVVSVDVTDRVTHERERSAFLEAERSARAVVEDAHRRLAFLAEASSLLDASLQFDEILVQLPRLAVPFLADVCVVEVCRDEDLSPAVVATPAPEDALEVRRLREVQGVPAAAARCVETCEAQLLVDPAGPYGRECEGPADLPWGVVVPLSARDGILGALVLLREGEGRVFSPADVALAADFGRRAGLALDNARLYELRSEVARHLQASLLPSSLPPVPNAAVAVRYVAAADGMDVGGDFYDLFAVEEGWAITVGDVCGRGAAAAAMTGLARHTLRAAARKEASPSLVLAELNEAILNERPDAPYCTVVHGRLHATASGGFLFNLACGGHPLPMVLRAGGGVDEVGQPGTIIGSFEEVDLPEATVELFPGDTLVCFTDGVVERRNPLNRHLFGEERLAATLAEFAGCKAEEVLDGLALALDAWGGDHSDDTAIVVLQVSAGPPRSAGVQRVLPDPSSL